MTGQKIAGICPFLRKEENRFVCAARGVVVFPGLEKCLVDFENCRWIKNVG